MFIQDISQHTRSRTDKFASHWDPMTIEHMHTIYKLTGLLDKICMDKHTANTFAITDDTGLFHIEKHINFLISSTAIRRKDTVKIDLHNFRKDTNKISKRHYEHTILPGTHRYMNSSD